MTERPDARPLWPPVFWGPVNRLGLQVAAAGFALDQLSKWLLLVAVDMPTRGKIVVTPFFDLVMAWNRGVSYGWLASDGDLGRILLICFQAVLIAGLYLWLSRVPGRFTAVAIGLVIGGALGNLLDRIVHGAVADFFSFHAFGYYWYIFNVADIWIAVGVGLLLLESFFLGRDAADERPGRR